MLTSNSFLQGIFLLLLLSNCLFPQMIKVPGLESINKFFSSAIIRSNDGTVHFFWVEVSPNGARSIWHKKQINGVWQSNRNLIDPPFGIGPDSNQTITVIKLPSGRILLGWKTLFHYSIYSDDNGQTWSSPVELLNGITPILKRLCHSGFFTLFSDGKIIYTHIRTDVLYMSLSSDSGATWSAPTIVGSPSLTGVSSGIVTENQNGELWCAFTYNLAGQPGIHALNSTNGGVSWSSPLLISSELHTATRIKINQGGGDTLTLYYETPIATPHPGIYQRDIYKIISPTGRPPFSAPVQITRYKGNDWLFSTSFNGDVFSFLSSRDSSGLAIYTSSVYGGVDEPVPPVIYGYSVFTEAGPAQDEFRVRVKTENTSPLSVKLRANKNGGAFEIIPLNDAGLFSDSVAGDHIYSHAIDGFVSGDYVRWQILVTDSTDIQVSTPFNNSFFSIGSINLIDTLQAGLMSIPYDNKGWLGNDGAQYPVGGLYDDRVFLFSAGFALSGKVADQLWANGSDKATRLYDYLPGIVGGDTADPRSSIFAIRSSDPPFGEVWQKYRYAVQTGAEFYDGNSDGIYSPIDLNSNNQWDTNEDAPFLIGDYTAYTVYNDARPAYSRRFNDQQPRGIQVAQTIITKSLTTNGFNETAFIRYTITNKGEHEVLDDVYFSVLSDPDLGDETDDLIGFDNTRMGGYAYNDGDDLQFGSNPPAFMQSFVQRPYTYKPGVTYTDINSNGLYDEGTDTPLDSISVNYGPVLGKRTIAGAGLAPIASFMHTLQSDPEIGEYDTPLHLRNFQLGFNKYGDPIDACIWYYGNGHTLSNCNRINSHFMYSGNPDSGTGWLNTIEIDQRYILTAGPFRMEKNKPVTFLISYAIGRGNNSLKSVNKVKDVTDFAHQIYNSNFTDYTTSVEENVDLIPVEFSLGQNYPNPFNPETTIRFAIPKSGLVKLNVYNILGQKVKSLTNEVLQAGEHTVTYNANELSSGIYFYRAEWNNVSITRKLTILK